MNTLSHPQRCLSPSGPWTGHSGDNIRPEQYDEGHWLLPSPHLKAKSHQKPADLILLPPFIHTAVYHYYALHLSFTPLTPTIYPISLSPMHVNNPHVPLQPHPQFQASPSSCPAPCWPQNHLSGVTDVSCIKTYSRYSQLRAHAT